MLRLPDFRGSFRDLSWPFEENRPFPRGGGSITGSTARQRRDCGWCLEACRSHEPMEMILRSCAFKVDIYPYISWIVCNAWFWSWTNTHTHTYIYYIYIRSSAYPHIIEREPECGCIFFAYAPRISACISSSATSYPGRTGGHCSDPSRVVSEQGGSSLCLRLLQDCQNGLKQPNNPNIALLFKTSKLVHFWPMWRLILWKSVGYIFELVKICYP